MKGVAAAVVCACGGGCANALLCKPEWWVSRPGGVRVAEERPDQREEPSGLYVGVGMLTPGRPDHME